MKLIVSDMSCQHCVKSITNQIISQDASATVNIDLEKKIVDVQSKLDQDKIIALIQDAGFDEIEKC